MVDNLEDQANKVGQINDAMSKMTGIVSGILPALKTLYDVFNNSFGKDGKDKLTEYTEGVDDISTSFKDLGDELKRTQDDINITFDAFGKLSQPVDGLIDKFTKLNMFVSNAKIFDNFASQGTTAINTISDNLTDLNEGLKRIGIDTTSITRFGRVLENASQSEKLENAYISLSAKAGNMNAIFEEGGTTLKDLSAITANYSNVVTGAAIVTGLGTKGSFEFANALKEIPGAMEEVIKTGDGAVGSTDSLIATMRLMTGTGRSQAEVMAALNTAYDKLGQSSGSVNDSTKKGSELLSLTSQVANTLKVRFDDVRGVMEAVADQFQFVGNETDAAGRMLAKYTDALRETGLTGKSSLEVIKGMITGIKEMSVGTKAFLSLRSGGPGGLQGAFQIEKMLREGKLDQITQMAERSLKQQFGGKIYTQEEAAGSPQAAAQFMRQRQTLQSGAFGFGKGLDDDKATRLLEALAKGQTGDASKLIKGGQDALKTATDRGTNLQERNNNELKKANTYLQRSSIAAEITAGVEMRRVFGTGTAAGQEKMRSDAVKEEKITNAAQSRLTQGEVSPFLGTKDTQIKELVLGVRESTKLMTDTIPGMLSKAGDELSGLLNEGKGAMKTMEETDQPSPRLKVPVAGRSMRPNQRSLPENRGREVLANAARTPIPQYNPAANTIRAGGVSRDRETQRAGATTAPHKVILELITPPGFDFKQTSTDPSDVLQIINNKTPFKGQ